MSYFYRFVKTIYLWDKLKKYKTLKNDCTTGFTPIQHSKHDYQSGVLAFAAKKFSAKKYAWLRCKRFIGGIIMGWIVFAFCVGAFRMTFGKVSLLSSFLLTFLSFGVAFSKIIRCYFLMFLPQLFSKRGRQALAAYAFILALGGPARNTLHNIGVLSSSFACTQEQVEELMRKVGNMVREPLRTLAGTLSTLAKDIKKAVQPVRDVVTRITQIFVAVCSVIENVFAWLGNIVKVCNKTTGTPFQRCLRSLNEAIADCQAKLGIMRFLCSIVSTVKALCATVRVLDTLCALVDVVSDAVVAKVKRRLTVFRQRVADMLSVSIELKHSININTTSSRSAKDVISSIITEVKEKTSSVRLLFDYISFLPGIAFIFLFIKVFLYRHNFLTSDRFDNLYINKFIVELDLNRIRRNLPTVLPLELQEQLKYTTVGSLGLVKHEKRKIASAIIFTLFTGIQIGSYLVSDICIYWTLVLIRREAPSEAATASMPRAGLRVEGHGALSALYQRLGQAFQSPTPQLQLNLQSTSCLPQPSPPNIQCYIQIGVLMTASLILAMTEPYGLRLRHVVMSYYYPTRARQRAVWLHNYIILGRGSFSLIARLQLKKRTASQQISLWKTLMHRNRILHAMFSKKITACSVCGTEDHTQYKVNLIPCPAHDCQAKICKNCINDLKHCIYCYELLWTENLNESSEARDSSDSEEDNCSELEEGNAGENSE